MIRALILAARARLPSRYAAAGFVTFADTDVINITSDPWWVLVPRLLLVALLVDILANGTGSQRRRLARGVRTGLIVTACFVTLGALAHPAAADPLVIRDDAGGRVDWRAAEIAELRRTGRLVELRGECMSACTMYLSLPGVCVAANATFGFHGPSFYGLPLTQHDFDYWSQVIAAHYPAPIADWYMSDARFAMHRLRRIRGGELIRMGYPECRG